MDLNEARYSGMLWNTPLSAGHADDLLERLELGSAASVLDLGCGWGELLLRAVAATSSATGVGVDTDVALLERGRRNAAERLASRTRFVAMPAAQWQEAADAVLCIGASHAWGDSASALRALRSAVTTRGRLLFGEGCWERPPTQAAGAIFGDDVLALGGLVSEARAAGWRVLELVTADQREWDEFESRWRAGREAWLAANASDPSASKVREELDARLSEYVDVYRGVLGFCYLVLAPAVVR